MDRELRLLTIEDYDDIIRLWSDAGLPYKPNGRDSRIMMQKEMQFAGCAFFGLYENDRMVSVGIANFDGRRGWVNRVAVDPDQRGKRLAAIIIEQCEQFLREQGAVVMTALIEEMNAPSVSCFHHSGYRCEHNILYFTKRDSPES
jgi:GNAT superfamily N-acetyltransferase